MLNRNPFLKIYLASVDFVKPYHIPLFICFCMPFVFGINAYSVANHSTYLLPGLMLAEPELWKEDWFANANVHYHILFSYMISILYEHNLLTESLLVLQYSAIVFMCWLVFNLVSIMSKSDNLPFYLLMLCFFVIDETKSIGLSYFVGDGFQWVGKLRLR